MNFKFQRILALQTIIIGNKKNEAALPLFHKIHEETFSLDLVETHSSVIEMLETRKNVIGWMYQFERTFFKHPCIRSFNY